MEMLGNKLLRGERVYLTAITRDDSATIARWFSDVELLRLTSYHNIMPQTVRDQEKRYDRMRKEDQDYTFGVRIQYEEKLIGIISINDPDWRSRWASIGVTIGEKAYWGKGYGTEAIGILLRYAFYELNLNRIELDVASYNERAIRSYKKAGFQQEVVRRQALYRDDTYYDIIVMSILRDEWLQAQEDNHDDNG